MNQIARGHGKRRKSCFVFEQRTAFFLKIGLFEKKNVENHQLRCYGITI